MVDGVDILLVHVEQPGGEPAVRRIRYLLTHFLLARRLGGRVRGMETMQPKVGQVWADNDSRGFHRQGTIIHIEEGRALFRWKGGRQTSVRLDRLKPNSTGYRLVSDA